MFRHFLCVCEFTVDKDFKLQEQQYKQSLFYESPTYVQPILMNDHSKAYFIKHLSYNEGVRNNKKTALLCGAH